MDMNTNDSPGIRSRREGGVGIVTISNTKKRNAFTVQMLKDIRVVFDAFDQADDVKSIVLEGEGDQAFASGDDISEFAEHRSTAADEARFMATALAAFDAPADCFKPVVAAIGGFCFGGAMQLAMACDVRICGRGSRFSVPASKLGVGYPMAGVARFVELIGAANTSAILLSGAMFSCEDLRASGFVTEMVADSEVKARAYAYAAELAERAPLTVRALKQSIAACATGSQERERVALATIEQCARSHDFIEGRNAFLEKRKPVFTGK
jgi:enoyl-CoA hydratase